MTQTGTDEELFESADQTVDSLRSHLLVEMEPFASRPGGKLVRLCVLFHGVLLHRVVDLASASLDLFRQSRLIPGCTLTRSLYETVGAQYHFLKKMAAATESGDLEDIHGHVGRASFGSRDGSSTTDAVQVLTSLDHLDREFRGSKGEYLHLCEYAHPNMKGGIATYARIDIPVYTVDFGINPNEYPMGLFGLASLDLILEIAKILLERQKALEAPFSEVVYRRAPEFNVE